jgi:hypothetical protein
VDEGKTGTFHTGVYPAFFCDYERESLSLFLQSVKLELEPINSAADIPTGITVHGTNVKAWESIRASTLIFP